MDFLAALGLLLCCICVSSPLHRRIRQLCKGPLVKVTIRQLPWVAAAQTRSNKVLDLAVLLSAATITLEVYLTLIPLITWSGNEKVALTRLLPHLALSGYVVFALKDLLESPRPGDCLKAAPDVHVTVRDPSGDIEDGVPSAHCCGAVSLLYYGIHAAAAAGLLSQQHRAWAEVAAAVWVLWLAWGRAYLGLHSPLDLATGALLGWAMLKLWLHIEQPYTAWLEFVVQQEPWQLPLQVLLISAVLMRCYPMPTRWTSCYNYATAWTAGWAGATVGWGAVQQGHLLMPAAAGGGSEWMFGGLFPPLACKVVLGLGMLAAAKVVVKAVLLAVFKPLFACVPLAVRCLWQPPIAGTVTQPQPKQQQQQQRPAAAGHAAAVMAEAKQDADGARDTADKRSRQHAADQLVLKPSSTLLQAGKAGTAAAAAAGTWGLRHSSDGVGNDVVAAARWCSYFAVGLVVGLWPAVWPHLQYALAPVVAAA